MTRQRYPESKNLSATRKICRSVQVPDHYAAAEPPRLSEDHPVDLLIEELPGMAAQRRNVARLRQLVERQVGGQIAFIRYEDARTNFAARREQTYFNLGYDRGHLAGLAESSAVSGTSAAAVRAFQGHVRSAVAQAKLPKTTVAAALMDVARAVVLVSRGR